MLNIMGFLILAQPTSRSAQIPAVPIDLRYEEQEQYSEKHNARNGYVKPIYHFPAVSI